ncbi:SgcJ/EcaC family oxidoreductase [Pseudomonas sp. URMO17WK12:I2]|uniref:SgcJ/EcaC family oxidoreductase n=1 Tax=Pseudomonas sp. URMO17WK12:I2 TaxID=1261623 RepID=UPI000DACA859|nr:SgcJ/EcaC family oxidoreductase [Pseudomonas sp. URMO17WK12:I2]PZW45246.1 uncharacterized protein (TIGR02246 family) [Pseudomonas sp. URMO17WK12:I2]
MKVHLIAAALLFCVSTPLLAAPEQKPYRYDSLASAPAVAADREVAGLFDQWNQALQSGDVAKVVSLYSADAVLQPTVSNRVRASSAEIRDYFEHFLALKPVGEINYREIRRLGPTTALDSGVYTFHLTNAAGEKSEVQARYTFVYTLVGGQWKILNHHSSAMPEVVPTSVASKAKHM